MHDNTTRDHPTREQNQEPAALLKILQLGTRQIETGLCCPPTGCADRVIARLRNSIAGTARSESDPERR